MHDTPSFIASYSASDQVRIAFAWNGKHAAEFVDANQDFRWDVIQHCLANPADASPLLLEHLFLADADWSAEAWGSPHHFAELGTILLQRGEVDAIVPFSKGFVRSFDTFGACHTMSISPDLLTKLSAWTRVALASTTDESVLKPLTAASDLFGKLAEGNASAGWATAASGTPVSNIRIVWPRWYHKLWAKVAGGWRAT